MTVAGAYYIYITPHGSRHATRTPLGYEHTCFCLCIPGTCTNDAFTTCGFCDGGTQDSSRQHLRPRVSCQLTIRDDVSRHSLIALSVAFGRGLVDVAHASRLSRIRTLAHGSIQRTCIQRTTTYMHPTHRRLLTCVPSGCVRRPAERRRDDGRVHPWLCTSPWPRRPRRGLGGGHACSHVRRR